MLRSSVLKGGYTPLDLATRKQRKDDVIELLREAKEVPKTDGQGESRDELLSIVVDQFFE